MYIHRERARARGVYIYINTHTCIIYIKRVREGGEESDERERKSRCGIENMLYLCYSVVRHSIESIVKY